MPARAHHTNSHARTYPPSSASAGSPRRASNSRSRSPSADPQAGWREHPAVATSYEDPPAAASGAASGREDAAVDVSDDDEGGGDGDGGAAAKRLRGSWRPPAGATPVQVSSAVDRRHGATVVGAGTVRGAAAAVERAATLATDSRRQPPPRGAAAAATILPRLLQPLAVPPHSRWGRLATVSPTPASSPPPAHGHGLVVRCRHRRHHWCPAATIPQLAPPLPAPPPPGRWRRSGATPPWRLSVVRPPRTLTGALFAIHPSSGREGMMLAFLVMVAATPAPALRLQASTTW